jgi:hypothetical protein
MKIVKAVVFVFVGLFILMTLISLLIPSKVVIATAKTVQADSVILFKEISDLKEWKNWHPVFKADSTGITFSEPSNEVNATAVWVTKGKENKIVITRKKYPEVEIAFQREGENDVRNILTIMPVYEQGNMQVQWQSITKLKWYPWEKFSGIFIEKMAGQGYDDALQSLKKYVETKQ